MPLYSKKQINNGIVALWQITESFEELLALVPKSWLVNVDLDKVAKHNLAARALANTVCPDFQILEKDEYGKPYFESALHKISITHTSEFAGFMLKEEADCGIDMEKKTKRILRIQSKFLRNDEAEFENHGLDGLYMVWCAKEAMYKYYGQKALDFKKHMKLEYQTLTDSSGELVGHIKKGSFDEKIALEYEFINDYLLVHTL